MSCAYCRSTDKPLPIFFNGADAPIVAIRDKQLEVMYWEHHFWNDKQIFNRKPINYCPICGTKLRETDGL